MSYVVVIPKPVQKQLDDLPVKIADTVLKRISALADNPRPKDCLKLKGYQNEYRIRIGDYRVRYEIHDMKLLVVLIQCRHRKDVYKQK